MQIRGSVVVGLTVAGALGGAVAVAAPDALAGSSQAPSAQQTHPSVTPHVGHRHSRFELTFTLAQAPGQAGFVDTYYREVVSPPVIARESCSPTQPPPVLSGGQGATIKLLLRPPASGWCTGRYVVTVFLQRAPSCGPPLGLPALIICPESVEPEPAFPVADLDTGQARFIVR